MTNKNNKNNKNAFNPNANVNVNLNDNHNIFNFKALEQTQKQTKQHTKTQDMPIFEEAIMNDQPLIIRNTKKESDLVSQGTPFFSKKSKKSLKTKKEDKKTAANNSKAMLAMNDLIDNDNDNDGYFYEHLNEIRPLYEERIAAMKKERRQQRKNKKNNFNVKKQQGELSLAQISGFKPQNNNNLGLFAKGAAGARKHLFGAPKNIENKLTHQPQGNHLFFLFFLFVGLFSAFFFNVFP